jgi:hypothetical protein
MAVGGGLYLLWGGKMEKWRPPDEDLPGEAQAFVLLLCGVGMVLQWHLAVPRAINQITLSVWHPCCDSDDLFPAVQRPPGSSHLYKESRLRSSIYT